jgi:two-component system NarL family response regulator
VDPHDPAPVQSDGAHASATARRAHLILCDDHRLLIAGLVKLLESRHTVVGTAFSGLELLALLQNTPANCVLLDLGLPDRAGMSLLPDIRRLQPRVKVLIVTMHVSRYMADGCLQMGADGFVPKDAGADELLEAIDTVLAGGRYLSPRVRRTHAMELAAAHPGWERLTPRQHGIVQHLRRGRTQKEIAELLGLSPGGIAFHVQNIKRTLGIPATAELIRQSVLIAAEAPPPRTSDAG